MLIVMNTKVSSKYQIVIPKQARKNMHLGAGDILYVEKVTKDSITLKKTSDYTQLVGTIPGEQTDAVKRIRDIRDLWDK